MTVLRTFTFPDGNARVITSYDFAQGDIMVGTAASTTSTLPKSTASSRYLSNRGVSNQPLWSTVSLTDGVDGILSVANGGTGNVYSAFSGPTALRTFALPDASANILTNNSLITLAQGGTGASLSASNGGIFYSTGSALALLAGTSTADTMLRSGASVAPTWSAAAWADTAGASSSLLASNGTNWVSQGKFPISVETKPYNSLGTASPFNIVSATAVRIGMFNIRNPITANGVSFTITGTSNPRVALKVCVYNEAGAKVVDVTTAAPAVGAQTLTTAISPAVTLSPGNYYITAFCSTTCGGVTTTYFGSTAVASMNGASIPSGKKVYEGTATMSSAGVCNTTLPAITGTASSTISARLDN